PHRPVLTRKTRPTIDRDRYASAEGVLKGGYIVSEAAGGEPQVILIGTGSELQYCLTAQERLEADGTPTRVVSMPCQEWFFAQDTAYQQQVLPSGVKARVTVEAGVRMSWDRILGEVGEPVSIEHYGSSAPGNSR